MASYTVLFADDGPAALSALGTSLFADRVVLLGRLGAPREDELFGILDVVDPEEVRARLAAAGLDVTRIELARWYATPALREFARLDAARSPIPRRRRAEPAGPRVAYQRAIPGHVEPGGRGALHQAGVEVVRAHTGVDHDALPVDRRPLERGESRNRTVEATSAVSRPRLVRHRGEFARPDAAVWPSRRAATNRRSRGSRRRNSS